MAKTKPERFKIADVADALRASRGIYTGAAAILAEKYGSCAPNTIRNYVERHPSLDAVRKEVEDAMLDLAESQLFELIATDKEPSTIRWYLGTKGRSRGYATRVETTGANGGPVQVEASADAVLAALARKHEAG